MGPTIEAAVDESAFDTALIEAAFSLIAEKGWRRFSVAEAARSAGLPLARARRRFPNRLAVLARFGVLADAAMLTEPLPGGPARDRLFDLVMRRVDVLQAHRAGVAAMLRSLPLDPPMALFLAALNQRSMSWLLAAAGLRVSGMVGRLRVHGMEAVWLWTVRAWLADESPDMAATLAALDVALVRAEQVVAWFPRDDSEAPVPQAFAAGETIASD